MSHLEAVLVFLLRNNNNWCGINDIRNYTKQVCKSECFQINTRVSELRTKYGYQIENDTYYSNGVRCSRYKISISSPILPILRSLYPWREIPRYSTISNLSGAYNNIVSP